LRRRAGKAAEEDEDEDGEEAQRRVLNSILLLAIGLGAISITALAVSLVGT